MNIEGDRHGSIYRQPLGFVRSTLKRVDQCGTLEVKHQPGDSRHRVRLVGTYRIFLRSGSTNRPMTSAQSIIDEITHPPRRHGRAIDWKGFAVSYLTDAISQSLPDTLSSAPEIGPKRTLAPSVCRLLRRIADWRSNRADVAALRLMTDHDLRDMGLSRLDVEVICEGAYRREM
jgi:uncharacterized protein YjiS (DUF1127 family)